MDPDRWERKRQRWEERWERRMERRRDHWNHPGRHLFSGVVLLVIGVLFLLGNMGYVNTDEMLRFWPVILIALGVMKLVESHDQFRSGAGIFWIVIGSLFLIGNLHILRIAMHDLWPVVLIGFGCLMLWRSAMFRREREQWTRPRPEPRPQEPFKAGFTTEESKGPPPSSNSVLSATAILGGVERQNNSQDFRGGNVTAIMGGIEIDLRWASITPPHEAVMEVFAMWGGIEIRVPADWTVISQVQPILGGFEDSTTPPRDESKRFILRGSVIMGGIEVKN